MSETGKRKFRVTLRTLVSLELDVEADGLKEALEAAQAKVRPADYFDGNEVAEGDGVEVAWAHDHAFAYVDELAVNGHPASTTPALFAGSNLDIREDEGGGWRLEAGAEYGGGN
jgi:hypothetical protein